MRLVAIRVSLVFAVITMSACSSEEASVAEGASSGPNPDAAFIADTEAYMNDLEQLGFAAGLLVARGENLLVHSGNGMADREASRSWSTETISTVGSITKQFTGAAILLLQEDGLLSVADPITKYFADVPEDKQSITLHQLLTHSSGIFDLDGLGDWDPIDHDTFVRSAMQQPLEFEPGTSYSYSNAGYSLLGAILEQITGTSYETFLRERLFLPAGMRDTGYILADWDEARLAVGYRSAERWGTVLERPLAEDGPYWVLRANGGIHATTADMFRWSQALLNGELLSSRSIDAYWAPHVDEGFGDSHYGYGWVVTRGVGDRNLITHNGGNGILFADMAIYPDNNVVMVLQTNVVSDWPLAQSLLEAIANRLFEGELYRTVPKLTETTPEIVATFAADYVAGKGEEKLVFRVKADGVELRVAPETPMTFARMHSTRAVDIERVQRLSRSIDTIVEAYVEHDNLQLLFDAYGGRATLQTLEERWESFKQRQEPELGTVIGYELLGTALRNGRDVTVARILFERGHFDSAFVWDPEQEEHLLGRSSRGLNPELRFVATGELTFGSWDGGFSNSRELHFSKDGASLTLAGSAGEIVAVRK